MAFVGELPNPFFFRAVRVDKVFVQDTLVVVPLAFHLHGETLDHLAIAVGEDAPGIHHAVEVGAQIEHRFLAGVIVDRGAGAAAEAGESGGGHATE